MKAIIIIVVAALLIVGGGAYIVTKNKNNKPTTTQSVQADSSAQPSATTITYSDNGFSPESISVKSGSTITIINSSSETVQFDSGPHPQHTDNADLNVGEVAVGKSVTFVVTKTGTFSYHNHLNPSQTGTVVVE